MEKQIKKLEDRITELEEALNGLVNMPDTATARGYHRFLGREILNRKES